MTAPHVPLSHPRPRPHTASRLASMAAATVATVTGLVVLSVALPSGPGPLALLGPSCAEAALAAGQVGVGLVIDFGTLPGAPGGGVRRECATVGDRDTGFKVLQAKGHSFRLNSSGLLCAIDGYPGGDDCGVRTATGYRYWAYFRGDGTGGWTYNSIGPGATRVTTGSVEGWHFVEAAGLPSDPPPAGDSHAASLCGAQPPTTTTAAPTPTATTAAPTPTAPHAPNTAPPPGPTSPTTLATLPGGAPAPTTATTALPAGGGVPSGPGPTEAGTPGGGSVPPGSPDSGTSPGTGPDGLVAPGAAGAAGPADAGGGPGAALPDGAPGDEVAGAVLAPVSPVSDTSGGSAPWLGLGLVAAVGALAARRFTARPHP